MVGGCFEWIDQTEHVSVNVLSSFRVLLGW